ncbi:MAG: penicillin-binding protein 2 [Planctomycetaceae bacterium]
MEYSSLDKRLIWRMRTLIAGLSCVWLILAARLVDLQWFHQADYARTAHQQRLYVEDIRARPGEIMDRDGRLLAMTVSTRSLFINPKCLTSPGQTAQKLAAALGEDPDRLTVHFQKHSGKQFLWVKRRLTDEQVRRVRGLQLPGDVWGFRDEYLRQYPQGHLAAHVLGLRDIDGHGRGGVEQSFDRRIRGVDGKRVMDRDARGHVLRVRDEVHAMPVDGRSVRLTIDSVIQLFTERELDDVMETWKPRSCTAIVLDPRSGEILAMASRPGFDPNQPKVVLDHAWNNTALGAVFEPGSTLKPCIVAWALEQDLLRTGESLDCENGEYRMGRRILHDHHPFGRLSIEDILVKSSNIGMAKIGERLGNDGLYRSITRFGFGQRTGIELDEELRGLVRPLKQWNAYSTGSVPMGQEIAVTPLQLLVAHAALANGGTLIRPRLVMNSQSSAGQSVDRVSTFCVKPEVANWVVRTAMQGVVDRGTGRKARISGVNIFGKTGTAQKIDPQTGRYASDRHVCSFVCGAPAEEPRMMVLLVVDEPTVGPPHFGGTVAAPSASRILERALGCASITNAPLRTANR